MYADTLFDLERGHLLRLGIWAAISALAGAVLLAYIILKKTRAPFVRHFAIQMLAWGSIDLAIASWGYGNLAFRDYAAAMQWQQFLWLNVGLDAGYAGIGLTLATTGWLLARRLGAVGAGVGILVQGVALFVLDVRILSLMGSPR
jgi:hypothetical protein